MNRQFLFPFKYIWLDFMSHEGTECDVFVNYFTLALG